MRPNNSLLLITILPTSLNFYVINIHCQLLVTTITQKQQTLQQPELRDLRQVKESILHIILQQVFAFKYISQSLKISDNQQIKLLRDVWNAIGFRVCHYHLQFKHAQIPPLNA